MQAYVAEGEGSENGVAKSMYGDIPVRVGHEAGAAFHLYAAEPHLEAFLYPMYIISVAYSIGARVFFFFHTVLTFRKVKEKMLNLLS